MFKSVFSRYVTAFMLIILTSFLVVLVVTSTSIGRFSNEVKESVVENTTDTAHSYLSSMLYRRVRRSDRDVHHLYDGEKKNKGQNKKRSN